MGEGPGAHGQPQVARAFPLGMAPSPVSGATHTCYQIEGSEPRPWGDENTCYQALILSRRPRGRGLRARQKSKAPSPVLGATHKCYQALILSRRPRGRGLRARQKSKAPSPVLGATHKCYRALILSRRPRGRGLRARQKSKAPSPVPGAINKCYQALILSRRPRGRWLRAKQKSRSVARKSTRLFCRKEETCHYQTECTSK